jgi:hypothetical protein
VDERGGRSQHIVAALSRDSGPREESLDAAGITREQAAEEVG